jgi:tubulin polyglutamylase TTLL6/13
VVINLCNCRYSVVEEAAGALGWTVTRDEKAAWDFFWTDTSVSEERLLKLKRAQRINHFAGMQTLARKTSLARLLRRVASHMPSAFTFMPQTWILPNEGTELKKQTKIRQRWVIVKPDGSCQGKGIFLTNNAEKACAYTPAAVAQEYVGPFLIDGFKFDIRIYVLVTSCDPLRVYLYQEGIARFCTKPYCEPNEENSKEISMHLTNFAINKKSDNFTCSSDGTSGFKRTLTSVWQWLDDHGHSSKDVINSIARLSVATLLSAQPTLVNTARSTSQHATTAGLRASSSWASTCSLTRTFSPGSSRSSSSYSVSSYPPCLQTTTILLLYYYILLFTRPHTPAVHAYMHLR